jgi:hypothetical protein
VSESGPMRSLLKLVVIGCVSLGGLLLVVLTLRPPPRLSIDLAEIILRKPAALTEVQVLTAEQVAQIDLPLSVTVEALIRSPEDQALDWIERVRRVQGKVASVEGATPATRLVADLVNSGRNGFYIREETVALQTQVPVLLAPKAQTLATMRPAEPFSQITTPILTLEDLINSQPDSMVVGVEFKRGTGRSGAGVPIPSMDGFSVGRMFSANSRRWKHMGRLVCFVDYDEPDDAWAAAQGEIERSRVRVTHYNITVPINQHIVYSVDTRDRFDAGEGMLVIADAHGAIFLSEPVFTASEGVTSSISLTLIGDQSRYFDWLRRLPVRNSNLGMSGGKGAPGERWALTPEGLGAAEGVVAVYREPDSNVLRPHLLVDIGGRELARRRDQLHLLVLVEDITDSRLNEVMKLYYGLAP